MSRSSRRLKKLQDKVHQWQSDTNRSWHAELWSRIRDADHARISLESGTRDFAKVSFRQRCADRFAAVFHSLRGLHRFCDPVRAYERRLHAVVRRMAHRARGSAQLRNIADKPEAPVDVQADDISKREDGTEITSADQLRAQIAYKQSLLTHIEQREQQKSESLEEILRNVDEEVKDAAADHKRWYSVLRRPAYYEVLRTSPAPLSETSGADTSKSGVAQALAQQQEQENKEGRISRIFKSMIGKYSAPVLVPLETAYSYTAFLLITPEDKPLALAAAFIFTLSLTVSGATAAHFWLRAIRHRMEPLPVKDSAAAEDWCIKTTVNGKMLSGALLMAFVGLVLVYGGADLRSKLPDVEVWTMQRKQIQAQISDLINKPLQPGADQQQRMENDSRKMAELQARLVEHDQKRKKYMEANFAIDSSDEIVALGVYFALFLAAAATYIMALDPFLEYGLLARYLAEAKGLRTRIMIVKDVHAQATRHKYESHQIELMQLRSRLWLLDKHDPVALSPYDKPVPPVDDASATGATAHREDQGNQINQDNQKDGKDKDQKEPAGSEGEGAGRAAAPSDTDGTDSKEQPGLALGQLWVAERLARYARWYVLFFGAAAANSYKQSFERALQRERI